MGLELDINDRVWNNLPEGGQNYLNSLSSKLNKENVVSIFLFGSVVSGETTSISDIDLIIVLDSGVSKQEIKNVKQLCSHLAKTHIEAGTDTPLLFEYYLERSTGMFRSGFVSTEDAVKSGNFPEIFGTSPFASIIAPWRTVLFTTFAESVCIYGSQIEIPWERVGLPMQYPYRELARSFFITFLLALAQVWYQFVSRRAIGYSLEATKWTAYNCAFHIDKSPAGSLESAVSVAPLPSWYLDWFLRLRDDPISDSRFILITPFILIFTHLQTVWKLAGFQLSD